MYDIIKSGANITAGSSAPVTAIVDAIAHASTVVINEKFPDSLALPSVSVVKGKSSVVIVGADESIVSTAASSPDKLLYGAYNNVLSSEGVAAVWGGVVGATSLSNHYSESFKNTPCVNVNGKAAFQVHPNNLSFPVTHLAFYDKNTTSLSSINEEEAVKRLLEVTDESKQDLIKSIVKGVKLSVIGRSTNLSSLL